MRLSILATLLLLALLLVVGCQEEAVQTVQPTPIQSAEEGSNDQASAPSLPQEKASASEQAEQANNETPKPPVFEDFQGQPQLTLFPRAGDFRPEDDSERLPYWNTFIEHLIKVTTIAEEKSSGNRAWTFRSINTIDSVGYFSPLEVTPGTIYHVKFKLSANLSPGASAGIGVLEFNQFLWIAGQYTETIYQQHFRGSHEGKRLSGKISGEQSFTFTTGPDTRMVHLVLFREGAHDRNSVMFDDIEIK